MSSSSFALFLKILIINQIGYLIRIGGGVSYWGTHKIQNSHNRFLHKSMSYPHENCSKNYEDKNWKLSICLQVIYAEILQKKKEERKGST